MQCYDEIISDLQFVKTYQQNIMALLGLEPESFLGATSSHLPQNVDFDAIVEAGQEIVSRVFYIQRRCFKALYRFTDKAIKRVRELSEKTSRTEDSCFFAGKIIRIMQ